MNQDVNFGDLPQFKPKPDKLLAVIVFLIEEATKLGYKLTQYDIVKSIFRADAEHLDKYGRPITYDNYIAMEHGPVGDMAISMLDAKFQWSTLDLGGPPWQRSAPVGKKAFFTDPSMPSDRDAMSGSDERMLLAAMTEIRKLGFEGVRRTTHQTAAWRTAYEKRTGNAAPMDWRLITSQPDDGLIDELVAYSNGSA